MRRVSGAQANRISTELLTQAERRLLSAPRRLRSIRERANSHRYGELVGPWFCGALVSQENAGGRATRLVRAAFRIGRGKLDVLFRSGAGNGGTLVRCDAR